MPVHVEPIPKVGVAVARGVFVGISMGGSVSSGVLLGDGAVNVAVGFDRTGFPTQPASNNKVVIRINGKRRVFLLFICALPDSMIFSEINLFTLLCSELYPQSLMSQFLKWQLPKSSTPLCQGFCLQLIQNDPCPAARQKQGSDLNRRQRLSKLQSFYLIFEN
jgi:hypothetical protein